MQTSEFELLKQLQKHRGLIRLHEEDLLRLFRMPEGYGIRAIFSDTLMNTINLVVYGPDLPMVPDGAEPPLLHQRIDVATDNSYEIKVILPKKDRHYGN